MSKPLCWRAPMASNFRCLVCNPVAILLILSCVSCPQSRRFSQIQSSICLLSSSYISHNRIAYLCLRDPLPPVAVVSPFLSYVCENSWHCIWEPLAHHLLMSFILYFTFQFQSFTLRSLLFLMTMPSLSSAQSEPSSSTLQSTPSSQSTEHSPTHSMPFSLPAK
jgi:hypothetical protein